MNNTQKEMIKEFQCPGCVNDCDPEELEFESSGFKCKKHCPGTAMANQASLSKIWLGLPKGFNRVPFGQNELDVLLYDSLEKWDEYDRHKRLDKDERMYKLNVPVWQYEKDGYLFVKSFSPRAGYIVVDVIKGATSWDFPHTINISDRFLEDID